MITIILVLTYGSVAASFAFALLRIIPRRFQPAKLRAAHGWEQAAVGGVIAGSLASAWYTASDLAASFQVPLREAGIQVLYGTAQGLGVLGALLFGAVWYGADALASTRKARARLHLAASAGLVGSTAASMHAATLSTSAYLAQAVHLLAVSAWLGTLLVVGWFAKADGGAWAAFYRWYSPMAAGCVAAVLASGIVLMSAFSTEWVNAWTLDYGQALLLKHLLIIPLLVLASINGLLIGPKAKRQERFDPRGWLRAESVLSLIVFAVTAVLSRQQPPHDVAETLRYTPPSAWFLRWYPDAVTPDIELAVRLQPMSLLLGVLAVLFLGIMYLAYARKAHPSLAICASLLFTAVGYVALMVAVQ